MSFESLPPSASTSSWDLRILHQFFSNSRQNLYSPSSTIQPKERGTSHFCFLTLIFVREVPLFLLSFFASQPGSPPQTRGVRQRPRRRREISSPTSSVGACVLSGSQRGLYPAAGLPVVCVPTMFLLPCVARLKPMFDDCYPESADRWVILHKGLLV